MPPKRKHTEESATTTSTRSTRSSTRTKAANGGGESSAAAAGTSGVAPVSENPPAKKSRKAPAKTTKATKGTKATKTATQPVASEAHAERGITNPIDDHAAAAPQPKANGSASSASLESAPPKAKPAAAAAAKAPESAPYTPARAAELFARYADEDDPQVIGPEGFERLCSEANIPLDGAMPLILAWLFKGSEMAKISKAEWDAGTSSLQIASPSALSVALHDYDSLLISNKPPLQPPAGSPDKKKKPAPEPYNRSHYYQSAADRRKAFNELYQFCFALAKPPQARNIDMETGAAFWSVLLVPQYPIMQDILDFINEKGTYKGVTKDLWQMVLEFCRTVSPDLKNYEADGAWPTLLDEFVSWKKSKAEAS